MKETSKQNIAILLITLLIIGVVFIYLNFIRPSLETIKNNQKLILETKEKIRILTDYKNKAEQLMNYYSNLVNQINNINLALPDEPQTDQILAIIDDLAQKNKLSIQRINFEESIGEDELGRVEVKMDFIGFYEDLKNFLKEAEKELRLSDLKSLSLKILEESQLIQKSGGSKTTKRESSRAALTGQLSLVFYYLPKK
jgi:Tfp pilus assembly protein PilO